MLKSEHSSKLSIATLPFYDFKLLQNKGKNQSEWNNFYYPWYLLINVHTNNCRSQIPITILALTSYFIPHRPDTVTKRSTLNDLPTKSTSGGMFPLRPTKDLNTSHCPFVLAPNTVSVFVDQESCESWHGNDIWMSKRWRYWASLTFICTMVWILWALVVGSGFRTKLIIIGRENLVVWVSRNFRRWRHLKRKQAAEENRFGPSIG